MFNTITNASVPVQDRIHGICFCELCWIHVLVSWNVVENPQDCQIIIKIMSVLAVCGVSQMNYYKSYNIAGLFPYMKDILKTVLVELNMQKCDTWRRFC